MKSLVQKLILGLLLSAALCFAACHKEGPAERAGEKADNALGTDDSSGEGPFEKAGKSIDDASGEASR